MISTTAMGTSSTTLLEIDTLENMTSPQSTAFSNPEEAFRTLFSARLKQGDHILSDPVPAFWSLDAESLSHMDVSCTLLSPSEDAQILPHLMTPQTSMILLNACGNPERTSRRIHEAAALAKGKGAWVVLNTTCYPYDVQRALQQGADWVCCPQDQHTQEGNYPSCCFVPPDALM